MVEYWPSTHKIPALGRKKKRNEEVVISSEGCPVHAPLEDRDLKVPSGWGARLEHQLRL